MIATEDKVYVLYLNKSFEVLKAEDIEAVEARSDNVGEMSSFAVDSARNEIWMADDKGGLFVFDGSTLNKIELEKDIKTQYGHPAISMAFSNGVLAVGDTKGYVTMVDCAAREIKSYFAHHSNKIF
jgi:ligand-binding sensor domain-containing protein